MDNIPQAHIDVVAVCKLAAEGNTQEEIGRTLKMNQAKVNRILKDHGATYIKTFKTFIENEGDPKGIMQLVQDRITRKDLQDQLSQEAKDPNFKLRVFTLPSGSPQWRLERFGILCAGYVKDLFSSSRYCGVTWGTHLDSLTNALKGFIINKPRRNKIEFIPLSGEPLGISPSYFSSSTLALRLNQIVNGNTKSEPFSLSAVPAFISPMNLTPSELRGIWKMIGEVEAYQKVFGRPLSKNNPQRPKVEQLDMLLTSLGGGGVMLRYGDHEMIPKNVIEDTGLNQLALGDLGGVLIPKDSSKKKAITQIQKRCTGLTMGHLQNCVNKAKNSKSKNKPKGVIVLALGEQKAELVLACIRLGLINQLLCCNALADKLWSFLTATDLNFISKK